MHARRVRYRPRQPVRVGRRIQGASGSATPNNLYTRPSTWPRSSDTRASSCRTRGAKLSSPSSCGGLATQEESPELAATACAGNPVQCEVAADDATTNVFRRLVAGLRAATAPPFSGPAIELPGLLQATVAVVEDTMSDGIKDDAASQKLSSSIPKSLSPIPRGHS